MGFLDLFRKPKECEHEWVAYFDKHDGHQVATMCSNCKLTYWSGGNGDGVLFEELDEDLQEKIKRK